MESSPLKQQAYSSITQMKMGNLVSSLNSSISLLYKLAYSQNLPVFWYFIFEHFSDKCLNTILHIIYAIYAINVFLKAAISIHI